MHHDKSCHKKIAKRKVLAWLGMSVQGRPLQAGAGQDRDMPQRGMAGKGRAGQDMAMQGQGRARQGRVGVSRLLLLWHLVVASAVWFGCVS